MTDPVAEQNRLRSEGTNNRQIYGAAPIVAHYASLEDITPCERFLFESSIPVGARVLDLGVGGGRTTAYLAKRGSAYVGIDYAPEMVGACRRRFPELQFLVADAADLSMFGNASFDAVVFAFNGIDYVLPDSARRGCLEHVQRILAPEGVLIFSSHNPRAVVARCGWSMERLRQKASGFVKSKKAQRGIVAILAPARWTAAMAQSIWGTVIRLVQYLPSRVFWKGEGERLDPVHGGLMTHYATPERMIREVANAGLSLRRVLGSDYPKRSHRYTTDWYYYVFVKSHEK